MHCMENGFNKVVVEPCLRRVDRDVIFSLARTIKAESSVHQSVYDFTIQSGNFTLTNIIEQ